MNQHRPHSKCCGSRSGNLWPLSPECRRLAAPKHIAAGRTAIRTVYAATSPALNRRSIATRQASSRGPSCRPRTDQGRWPAWPRTCRQGRSGGGCTQTETTKRRAPGAVCWRRGVFSSTISTAPSDTRRCLCGLCRTRRRRTRSRHVLPDGGSTIGSLSVCIQVKSPSSRSEKCMSGAIQVWIAFGSNAHV